MEQRSDVNFRAEKLYKNSREKFGYLIREVVSNAIHAVVIRKRKLQGETYRPKVIIKIDLHEKDAKIVISDNGEGFTGLNRKYFTHLDSRNSEKDKLKLHPKGQGRLAIVYFSDSSTYTSIYTEDGGVFQKRIFDYPKPVMTLFDIDDFEVTSTDETEVGTDLELNIFRQQTFSRAKTFFSKYSNIDLLKDWFTEQFFPFFMEHESLELQIVYCDEDRSITKESIEKDVACIPFNVILGEPDFQSCTFSLWLVSKNEKPKTKNTIHCYARDLRAEIEGAKLEYDIDLQLAYDWFLTSPYFDDLVDEKGDKLELSAENFEIIQTGLNTALDAYFAPQIELSRKITKKNIDNARKKFNSLSIFIEPDKEVSTRRVLSEGEIVSKAIEAKGKMEKCYWSSQKSEGDEFEKLINSSLQIYINHRSRVLNQLFELIQKFNDEGEAKIELEESIHDLFLRRGKNLSSSDNINHLHNLWILDDKYTIFSKTFKGLSSKKGQEASDIYIWADDLEKTRELLILELKSPSFAHNAGDKYESMVAQVKRYAKQFYLDPQKTLNWDVIPDRIMYLGVVIARKSDINKEINSNNGTKTTKIPFLESSYYCNEEFSVNKDVTAAPIKRDIRIELYSYEDIYSLASARNAVFFKLLQGEFGLDHEATADCADEIISKIQA